MIVWFNQERLVFQTINQGLSFKVTNDLRTRLTRQGNQIFIDNIA